MRDLDENDGYRPPTHPSLPSRSVLLGWWAQRPPSFPWSDAKGPYVWSNSSRPLNLFRKPPLPAGSRGDPEAALLQPGCGKRVSDRVGLGLKAEGGREQRALSGARVCLLRQSRGRAWRRG